MRGDDYGSILLGSAGETALRQRVRIQTLLTFCLIVANAGYAGYVVISQFI